MFERNLILPERTDDTVFTDAAAALKQEYRHGSRLLKLRCRQVEQIGGEDSDIFRLEVAGFPAMNWTWEGASAWRPKAMEDDAGLDDDTDDEKTLWKGEMLEVDEDRGHLYVATGHAGVRPCKGQFLVKPFEFLAQLHALYHDEPYAALRNDLTDALEAARAPTPEPLPDDHPHAKGLGLPGLQALWDYPLTVLWGPPGTGKTHHIGLQVAELFKAGVERVLVLSTTNRATDAAALTTRGRDSAAYPRGQRVAHPT